MSGQCQSTWEAHSVGLLVHEWLYPAITARTVTSETLAVPEEDAFPAPRCYFHRSLPHCDRGIHSLPGLVPEPPTGFLPLLRGAGGGHAHPGALLGNEQQKCCELQPPGVRPRVSTLSIRLPQLWQPCPLHTPGEPLARVPVSVPSQVGEKVQSVKIFIRLLCIVQSELFSIINFILEPECKTNYVIKITYIFILTIWKNSLHSLN